MPEAAFPARAEFCKLKKWNGRKIKEIKRLWLPPQQQLTRVWRFDKKIIAQLQHFLSMEASGVKSSFLTPRWPLRYWHSKNLTHLDFTPETFQKIGEKMLILRSRYRRLVVVVVLVLSHCALPCRHDGNHNHHQQLQHHHPHYHQQHHHYHHLAGNGGVWAQEAKYEVWVGFAGLWWFFFIFAFVIDLPSKRISVFLFQSPPVA